MREPTRDGIPSGPRVRLITKEGTIPMPEEANGTLFPKDPAFYKDLLDHMSDGVYFVDR